MAHRSPTVQHALAYALLTVTFINVNGVVAALSPGAGEAEGGFESLLFYLMALPIAGLFLIRNFHVDRIRGPYLYFLAFIFVYLVSATTFSLINGQMSGFDRTTLFMYVFQAFFATAVYAWAAELDPTELEHFFRFAKAVLLLAALGIVLSPILPNDHVLVEGRAAGFFFDQNEAAFASLSCLVLIFAYPARYAVVTLLQAAIATTALLLTFSRTGLLAALVLCGLYIFTRGSVRSKIVTLAGLAVVAMLVWTAYDTGTITLSPEQTQRLQDVGTVLEGGRPQKTYDQRDILFDIAVSRIAERLPWGEGIGRFHSMEYGVRHWQSEHWLGAHSTYLMILGESGLPGMVAFIVFWVAFIDRALRSSEHRVLAVGMSIVVLANMMTTHSVMSNKIAMALLALTMAALVRQPSASYSRLGRRSLTQRHAV